MFAPVGDSRLIKPDVANDRVKLARWCHMHKLTAEALEQARIALELQPEHTDAKQMVMRTVALRIMGCLYGPWRVWCPSARARARSTTRSQSRSSRRVSSRARTGALAA